MSEDTGDLYPKPYPVPPHHPPKAGNAHVNQAIRLLVCLLLQKKRSAGPRDEGHVWLETILGYLEKRRSLFIQDGLMICSLKKFILMTMIAGLANLEFVGSISIQDKYLWITCFISGCYLSKCITSWPTQPHLRLLIVILSPRFWNILHWCSAPIELSVMIYSM